MGPGLHIGIISLLVNDIFIKKSKKYSKDQESI